MLKKLKRYLRNLWGSGDEHIFAGLERADRALIDEVRARKLTYLSRGRLASLCNTCRSIEQAGLSGLFLETGCALGGSTVLLSRVKQITRPLRVYDVFGMIPAPTEQDPQEVHERYRTIVTGESKGIGGDKYYGYENGLRDIVLANLRSFGVDCEARSVALIQGLVQDTLVVDQPVAFAHIDVDWYEPVMISLQRIVPQLVLGGSIILDDYHDWGGCRKAADEYLQAWEGHFRRDDTAGSMKITRIAA